jgi:hypothetical protein
MKDEKRGIITNFKTGFWTCSQGTRKHYKGEGKG